MKAQQKEQAVKSRKKRLNKKLSTIDEAEEDDEPKTYEINSSDEDADDNNKPRKRN